MTNDALHHLAIDEFTRRYSELAGSVHSLAEALSDEQFWRKPFEFGNSFGHLVLHLTGNLNYYIGAEIGQTGYVRDRPREFTEATRLPKGEALKRFDAAVATVLKSLRSQSAEDWTRPYTAKGEESAANRFTIFLRCCTHLHHHVGQMHYLAAAVARKNQA